jgi:hypothetical protein
VNIKKNIEYHKKQHKILLKIRKEKKKEIKERQRI